MFQIWFEPVQTANCYTSKQQLTACLHLDKHFLLHFNMKCHWMINKSISKLPLHLAEKSAHQQKQCDAGLINWLSDEKALKGAGTEKSYIFSKVLDVILEG